MVRQKCSGIRRSYLVAMPDELSQKVEMREQSVEYHGHNEQKARH